jgi:hypothetical protein
MSSGMVAVVRLLHAVGITLRNNANHHLLQAVRLLGLTINMVSILRGRYIRLDRSNQ